jgi:hypothetical protein
VVDYDPFSEEVMTNPYPVYARLRAEAPVYRLEKFDAWALSRFHDIWEASSDRRFSTARGTTSSHVLTRTQPVTPMLNLMDPPDHTRLRAAVRPAFLPRAVHGLEPVMRELVRGWLDEAAERGTCDVVGDLSARLSVRVACLAIGIPLPDAPLMHQLVWRFFGREPGVEGMTADGLAAAQELIEYFVRLARERRRSGDPTPDVVNLFRDFELDGRRFGDEEIASHLSMLIIGGSETFPKTFANAVWRLAEHPDQRTACAADPSLVPDAYLEALRYDMPTQFLCRTLLEDVTLHGQTLRAGDGVLFLYPSGNRDEREFSEPDRFDIRRRPPRILSFGAGTHACLGLHVAKAEGKVCLEELLARFPDYEVDAERAVRLRTEFVQGFAALPIRLSPR